YSFGPRLQRKEFHRFGVEMGSQTSKVELDVTYTLDEQELLSKTIPYVFSPENTTAKYGTAKYGLDVYGGVGSRNLDFLSSIRGTVGRRGQTIQFTVQDTERGFTPCGY